MNLDCPFQTVREMLNMKIFVDTDSDIRLVRRIDRDTKQRGRDLRGVIEQYERHVKPAFDHFIAPTKVHADLIVPRGGENSVAIDLIVRHIRNQLIAKGHKLREELGTAAINDLNGNNGIEMPSTLHILPLTPQIWGLHTFIRNKDTPRDEFMFYARRLIRLIIEHALSLMSFEPITVQTPQGVAYVGKKCTTSMVCGVSLICGGEPLEEALNQVCKDVRVGQILIQTNRQTGGTP